MTLNTIPPQTIEAMRQEFAGGAGEPPIPGLLSLRDIMCTDWPEPEWIVPEYLPAGLTILAGKPKMGKSWLALQIALSVITGGHVLGRRVRQGSVLYLALEDPERRIKDRMTRQNWPTEAQVRCEFMPLGRFKDTIGDLKDGGGVTLARQIEYGKYRLVVIDTLSRALSGDDQNEAAAMNAAIEPLHIIANEKNVAILLIDHHRKNSGFGDGGDAVADILGSTAKGALSDCAWGLYRERGKQTANLSVTGRDVVEVTLAMTMDWVTYMWHSEGDLGGVQRAERQSEIIAFIEASGAATLMQIAKELDVNKGSLYKELNDLVFQRVLTRNDGGKGRVTYSLMGQ